MPNIWKISFTDEYGENVKTEKDLYNHFKKLMEESLKYGDLTGFKFEKIK